MKIFCRYRSYWVKKSWILCWFFNLNISWWTIFDFQYSTWPNSRKKNSPGKFFGIKTGFLRKTGLISILEYVFPKIFWRFFANPSKYISSSCLSKIKHAHCRIKRKPGWFLSFSAHHKVSQSARFSGCGILVFFCPPSTSQLKFC